MSPKQRVSEFPNEQLTVSNSKLFCKACREELSLKKTVIASHIQSAKHKTGKNRLSLKEARERDIAESLVATDQQNHPVGEMLPLDQRVYRVKVLKTFLRAAVPLSKLDIFRELLEENSMRLTERVFSILKQSFGDQQFLSLQDYIEASLMLYVTIL